MSESVTIVLPLPDRKLSPNARLHYMAKANIVRAHRERGFAYARMEYGINDWCWPSAELHPTFYFKTRARRDRDNCAAMLKSYIDGICDAGLVSNDRFVVPYPPKMEYDKENPRVELQFVKLNKAVA